MIWTKAERGDYLQFLNGVGTGIISVFFVFVIMTYSKGTHLSIGNYDLVDHPYIRLAITILLLVIILLNVFTNLFQK